MTPTGPSIGVHTDPMGSLVLAVEVLSPSTRRKDQVLKRAKYEESGVQSYWIVDPEEPSLLALDLVEGRYTTATGLHTSYRQTHSRHEGSRDRGPSRLSWRAPRPG